VDFLIWLNDNGSAIQALTSIVLAALTLVYVILTRRMVLEMKAVREPSMFMDVYPGPYLSIIVVIGNKGNGTAYDVSFSGIEGLDRVSFYPSQKALSGLPIISEGISHMPVGKIVRITGRYNRENGFGSKFQCVMRYRNLAGQTFSQSVVCDLELFRHVEIVDETKYQKLIAESLREIVNHGKSEDAQEKLMHYMTRQCPVCCERISPHAQKCPHCLEFIRGSHDEASINLEE